MARGRGRGSAASKRKANADDNASTKRPKRGKKAAEDDLPALKREDSENTKIRKAITEASKTNQDIKIKKYKPDIFLSGFQPKASIHEDFACMLNQTNIGHNNNKFYVIQVAKANKDFICFTRWGRV
ncbi:hypothetical protein SK128_021246, partial [Halocaridina rubra]